MIEYDVPVEIEGVTFRPGELVFADEDGVVVVPRQIEREALERARKKVHDESEVREAIAAGMKAAEAYASSSSRETEQGQQQSNANEGKAESSQAEGSQAESNPLLIFVMLRG